MKIAVNVLNFGPGATAANLRGWARFAEDTGFHAAMISDHVTVTPDVAEQYPAPFYDPFATLAWLAGITERVELGTSVVILPYRSPLQTARLMANIDHLSQGRTILGVGVGWAKQEFDALRVPFERRGAITDEYLTAIRRMWTEEVVTLDGEFVSATGVSTAPLPVRTPPVWVGGSSRAGIRRAVRLGTSWHPINARLTWLREQGLPALRAEAQAQGAPLPGFAPRTRFRITDTPLDDEKRLPCEGTLDQIRGDLREFAELGAEYLMLDTYRGKPDQLTRPEDDWRELELFAGRAFDLGAGSVR
ncbi:TIGR03619 family F420-dependent LLM class oxidoreductase [Saccharopolyspora taberi]|uniref:LLM class flavin-dependent oxidoreductase n=1 Tax=Saccharopolyspora taberi TaxID=60895 RepID=A0ABN3VJN7_9PSEU